MTFKTTKQNTFKEPVADKPFPYVQVMLALFILFFILDKAGCMSPVNNPGL